MQRQQSPRGSEHHKYLERGKGQKWLSLFVTSRARDAVLMPIFFEKDDISGRVEIDLDKAESVKSITISVRFDGALSKTNVEILSRSKEEPPLSVRKRTFSYRRRKLYGRNLQKPVPS